MKKELLKIMGIILLVTSCATINEDYIFDESVREPVDELSLKMGYDIYKFRVDILRRTTTTTTTSTNAQGHTSTTTQTVDVPYHYLGVRFGNGIFLDYNQNLSIDLVEFFNLGSSDFRITRKNNSLFSTKIIYKKTDNNFSRELKSLFGNTTTAVIKNDSISIKEGLFKNKVTINKLENEYQMIPEGVFDFLGKAKIIKNSDGSISFPGLWKDSLFTQIDDTKIKMDDYFHISNLGNKIDIQYNGLFGYTTNYTFAKIKNGFIFYDKNLRGVLVQKEGNIITVSRNSKKLFTASINKLD